MCYMGHYHFLPLNHLWQNNAKSIIQRKRDVYLNNYQEKILSNNLDTLIG